MAAPEFHLQFDNSFLQKYMAFIPLLLVLITIYLLSPSSAIAVEAFCPSGSTPDPNVLWCDDFDDSIPLSSKYFEYNDDGGDFVIVNGIGFNGSSGMQVVWQPGEVDAGNFKMTFGRNPVNSRIFSNIDFKEVYWRIYVKMKPGWTGNPGKLSRATILAAPNWAQAMIAHIWNGSGDMLAMDPASGIDTNGNLATTTYNDFPNLRWLGNKSGVTPIFSSNASGQWFCVEAHVKLNTPGLADGVFEFWVNGNKEAGSNNLDWVGTWEEYGINAIFVENYWNSGAPGERIRYLDNFVISRTRIGCNADVPSTQRIPNPPSNLAVN